LVLGVNGEVPYADSPLKSHPTIVVCACATPIHPTVSASSSEARSPPKLLLSLRGSERRRAIPTHHFVNLKFELPRMFFIFLVSYFLSPDSDDFGRRHQKGRNTPELSWIHSHTDNLLLLSPKARTILLQYHDTYFAVKILIMYYP